ncbi:AAA family ATPase [bacterium]|jgi:DNA repair protein RecN (Recombination protein N)|nr:AAA family ATPase [bacterium]
MIKQLRISNFLTITNEDIDFKPGFSVFTGETGAGKSILIEALSIVLGAPANESFIKIGNTESFVEGQFELSEENSKKFEDLTFGETSITVFRRISNNKPNIIRVNQQTCSLKKLRELAGSLCQVVNQHEQLELFDRNFQLDLVDAYSALEIKGPLLTYRHSFQRWQDLRKKMSNLGASKEAIIKRMDYLDFQINEIESYSFEEHEEGHLDNRLKELNNLETLKGSLRQAQSKASSAYSQLGAVENSLDPLAQSGFISDEINEYIKTAMVSLEETQNMFSKKSYELMQVDESDLERIEERVKLIFDTKSKYHCKTLADLAIFSQALMEKRKAYDSSLKDYNLYEQEKSDLESDMMLQQNILFGIRQKAVESFQYKIKVDLINLEFQFVETRFEVFLEAGKFDKNAGMSCNFLISTLPGHEVKELSSVLSGGEISRLLLSIHKVVQGVSGKSVLVFDEIDTGIGGVTAKKMGEMMSDLSKKCQILAVTHLPQIASQAEHHFLVKKRVSETDFSTSIQELNKTEKEDEYLRMNGHIDFAAVRR